MDQWNRIEPRNKPIHLWPINLPKRRQEYAVDTAVSKSVKLEPIVTPYTKVNSKWLKDLNIRLDTIKIPRRQLSKTFSDINCTNVFLGWTPKNPILFDM